MAYWHLGDAVWSRSPVPNSRGQVSNAAKLTGSRPSSTALSVPTAPSHMALRSPGNGFRAAQRITPGTRDAATIASPPPNPSPQVIKRAGSVDDRPMAAWASVRASKYRSSRDNAAQSRRQSATEVWFSRAATAYPRATKRVMWCQPRTPRPRSWNMSTVGTAPSRAGRMYLARISRPLGAGTNHC
jgi:hypothetical protein